MQSRWYRTHVLLKAAQRRRLTQIARQEGRSLSEITREMLDLGLQARDQAVQNVWVERTQALKQAQLLREKLRHQHRAPYLKMDLNATLHAVREERDNKYDTDSAKHRD